MSTSCCSLAQCVTTSLLHSSQEGSITFDVECREAASAELESDQLREVQQALQKMHIYHQGPEPVFETLGDAVGTVLQWLDNKADGRQLSNKGTDRFEKVWETSKVWK